MNKKKCRQILSGFLAIAMALCSFSTLSAAQVDQQQTDDPYPYTIFAASSQEGAITIDANNFCINGSIATNGTLSTSGNVNINGEKTEQAYKGMIYIFDSIEEVYFTETKYEEYKEDYSITKQNINIDTPVEVKGEFSLDGNINLTTAVKALEDIILNGEVKNTEDSILFSKYGDIVIDSKSVNLNGLVYAPFGCVSITAQNLTMNNIIIIANEVEITCGSVNANYSSSMARFVGNESEKLHIPEDEQKYLEGKDVPEENSSEEDNSEEDNSEEVDSKETDSKDETEDFHDWFSRFDEWENLEDTDGDGLPDAVEHTIGSGIDIKDTDGDGLDDYYEVIVLGTSPTAKDTDENGIHDSDEDFDKDRLSNYEEYLLDTYPWEPDTDEDNLSDRDEVYIYGTDPHLSDSDTDGLLDGNEPGLGTDPLNPDTDGDGILDSNESFEQTYTYDVENTDKCAVSQIIVETEATGNLESTTTIVSIMGKDVACSKAIGLVGEPFEIETTSEFETARLTFVMDQSKLGDTNLSDLLFLWYDEENSQFVELETTYDEETGKVSTETTHFSSYLLVDRTIWFGAWEKELDYSSTDENTKPIFTYIGVDLSSPKNMNRGFIPNDETDPEIIRKSLKEDPPYDPMTVSICETLIDNMKADDKMEMHFFTTNYCTYKKERGNKKDELKDLLYKIDNTCFIAAHSSDLFHNKNILDTSYIDGYSDYEIPLIGCYASGMNYTRYEQRLFIISSGRGRIPNTSSYSSSLKLSRIHNIHINTIAVGENAGIATLRYIANYTGGKCYVVKDEEDLEALYAEILNNRTIDDSTDTDRDGIPDTMEIQGIRNQWGEIIYTDPSSSDTDGDGLLDGEEIDIKHRKNHVCNFHVVQNSYYYYMHSNPNQQDSDGDGYTDKEEIKTYKSNPLRSDVTVYKLSQDYIQVNYTGETAWDNFGSFISYGGAQDWFANLDEPHNNEIDEWGCGLISGADILLYLAKGNLKYSSSKYRTPDTDKVKYIDDSGYIEYGSYMEYLSYMEQMYFPINQKNLIYNTFEIKGIDGLSIQNGMNRYMDIHNIHLDAQWGMSKSKILPRIEEMLQNDIPVMLSGDATEKNTFVNLYRWNEKAQNYEQVVSFSSHYVTVTGLTIDDIGHKTWLEVSSWGRKYFIDYNEYISFMTENSNRIVTNILYIRHSER